MMARPWPPASTTPASRSTGSMVGVSATDSREAALTDSRTSMREPPEPAVSRAAWAALLMTVSMVPSTGSPTALYACSRPTSRAAASRSPSSTAASPRPEPRPLKNWERMTPLLPLAPMRAPRAMAEATSAAEPVLTPAASSTTASMVRCMLVPVSPSGTGNTLRAFTASTLADSRAVASENMVLRSPPPILSPMGNRLHLPFEAWWKTPMKPSSVASAAPERRCGPSSAYGILFLGSQSGRHGPG